MKTEKFKLFVAEHYKCIYTIVSIIVICALGVVLFKTGLVDTVKKLSSEMIAMLGALFGAIIGGVFTLVGTKYSYKNQLEAQIQIKRKNLIYKPLYDELAKIHYYFTANPYPHFINVGREEMWLPQNSPQYTTWDRIISDTRYLEVSDNLKKEMKKLYACIENYTSLMSNSGNIITNILSSILEKQLSTHSTIINIGDCLSTNVLTEHCSDIFAELHDSLNPKVEICQEEKIRISNLFYAKCLENKGLGKVKKSRSELVEQEERTIDLLATLIKTINKKYEG